MKKKLEAVNRLLKVIGEPPLLNEDDLRFSYEAELADKEIESVKDSVLSEGFKFNRLTLSLAPDVQGYIPMPPKALVMEFRESKYAVNEGLVYDRENLTFKFTQPVEAIIIYTEQFDYIPPVLQEYIVAKALVSYQRAMINDGQTEQSLLRELQVTERAKNIWHINQVKANGVSDLFSRNTHPQRN